MYKAYSRLYFSYIVRCIFFIYEGSTVYKSFLLSVTNYFEIKESAAVHFAASPLDGDILQTEKV